MNQTEFNFRITRIKDNIAKGIKLTDEDKRFLIIVAIGCIIMYGFIGFFYLIGTLNLDTLMELKENVNNGSNSTGENR